MVGVDTSRIAERIREGRAHVSDFPTHIIRDTHHPALRGTKGVLVMMADRLKSLDDVVWAAVGTIAEDAGVHERTVQRVISWAMSVGILVVVRHGGRRCFRFDFARLQSLPGDAPPFAATERPTVAKPRPAVTPETVPDARHTVTPERLPVADARLTVVSPVTVGHPKVSEKESSKESLKVPVRKAPRPKGPPTDRSPEQKAAHHSVMEFWCETFKAEKRIDQIIVTGHDGKDIYRLLEFVQFDVGRVKELITNAFADVWFREKTCSLAAIVKQPSRYQAAPLSTKPRNTGQTDMPDDFFAKQDARLAAEYGQ